MKKYTFEEYHKLLMESFKKINEFMEENNIKWWGHSGTLLGAARHGDIIPWDDDIDMAMTIFDWKNNQKKIEEFLETIGWEVFDRVEVKGLDATRMFSKEKIIIEFEGQEYITKLFIDVMLAIPKDEISKFKRKIWSWFNQYNYIFTNNYRLIPYYGWFGTKVKRIYGFVNFLVFFQKILLYIFTFWVPILQKKYLKKKNYAHENVAMYYNYDNRGVIYNIHKINSKLKFGDTTIFVSDDWKNELIIWFGNSWTELPPKWNRVPHHFVLTKKDGKNDKKYKISPYIFI